MLFNQDDQFGFFYDEDGYPTVTTDEQLQAEADKLYRQYDAIIVTSEDKIYGQKPGSKELIMDWADDSYSIALEVSQE